MGVRHYYELMLTTGRSHKKYPDFYEFISGQSWPSLDYTGSPLRIADSSLSIDRFTRWVADATGVKPDDLLVEEITASSPNHDDYRETIEKYFKVKL